MDGEMKGIDHRMSRGVGELKREKEIHIESSLCGSTGFYFKFVLILGVLVRSRNICGLSSQCRVCLQLLIFFYFILVYILSIAADSFNNFFAFS